MSSGVQCYVSPDSRRSGSVMSIRRLRSREIAASYARLFRLHLTAPNCRTFVTSLLWPDMI